jgi:hypothetical protein
MRKNERNAARCGMKEGANLKPNGILNGSVKELGNAEGFILPTTNLGDLNPRKTEHFG